MPEPANKTLYKKVKTLADKKFLAPTSAYKSAWIVKEYKRLGGTYTGEKPSFREGLVRWFKEKWVDLNRPGKPCGRAKATTKGKYPLCRPTVHVSSKTPKLAQNLTKKQIVETNKRKQKVKATGRISYHKKKT